MPAAILGLATAGIFARCTRASMLDVMRSKYVTTARAKGLRERTVVVRHVFRNALLPIVTIVAADLPALLAGAIITRADLPMARHRHVDGEAPRSVITRS